MATDCKTQDYFQILAQPPDGSSEFTLTEINTDNGLYYSSAPKNTTNSKLIVLSPRGMVRPPFYYCSVAHFKLCYMDDDYTFSYVKCEGYDNSSVLTISANDQLTEKKVQMEVSVPCGCHWWHVLYYSHNIFPFQFKEKQTITSLEGWG